MWLWTTDKYEIYKLKVDRVCNNVLVHNNEFQQQELPASMSMIFNDIHDILMIFMAILMVFIVMDNGNGASSPHGF